MITTLAQLIAQVESNGNPLAVRFEPAHHPAENFVTKMQALAKCNFATAQILCAMSWGEFQIMGDNLVALDLSVSPFEYLHNENMQYDFFAKFSASNHLYLSLDDILNDPSQRQLFARLYNGPGNFMAYAQRIVDVAKANGLEIVS